MTLGPRTQYQLNIALITIGTLAMSSIWIDLLAPIWAKVATTLLLIASHVLTFTLTGVRPPTK